MRPNRMVAALNRTLLYSWLSYRALFYWASPRAYVASLLILPVSLGFLFVIVNDAAQADTTLPMLGGALLATNNAVMYGLALVIMEERWQATLDLWLAAPQGLLRSLLAKSIVHALNGLITGAISFAALAAIVSVKVPAEAIVPLVLCALSVAVSATGIAFLTAAIGIWVRDALVAPNAMRSLILLTSGAMVDVAVLGFALDRIGWLLPVRHAVVAATQVLHGQRLDGQLLAAELAVGGAWGLIGYLTLRFAVARLRRSGRLNLT